MNRKYITLILSLVLMGWLLAGPVNAQDSEDDFSEDSEKTSLLQGIELSGFAEIEQGLNITGSGPHREGLKEERLDWMMANRRFRLKTSKTTDKGGIFAKLDFYRDEVTNRTYIDIRELRLQYRLFSWLDISVGRQVATWGLPICCLSMIFSLKTGYLISRVVIWNR